MYQHFLTWNIDHKAQIISGFKILYLFFLALYAFAAYAVIEGRYAIELYTTSRVSGQIALILFCIVITPGILRRFGIRIPVATVIMLYRRYLGIATFLFAFYHYAVLQLFPVVFAKIPLPAQVLPFLLFGFLSVLAMTVLFFTSNDWSVKHLGVWWSRIHALVYIIAWTIFLHVFLQRVSIWSVLMGIYAVAETVSLVYYYILRKPTLPPPPQVPQQPVVSHAYEEVSQTNA